MIDNYKILTLTFSDAHLDALADYLISSDNPLGESKQLLSLKKRLGVEELYYLSTCNRVLYLFYTNKPVPQLQEGLTKFLKNPSSEGKNDLELNHYSGEAAIRHFFEVTSSLKSMVIGEQEILR